MPRLPAVIATRWPGLNSLGEAALGERLAHRLGDVGQVLVWELLANPSHARQWRSRKIHDRPPGSDASWRWRPTMG